MDEDVPTNGTTLRDGRIKWIRITSHGKIKSWVCHSLNSLLEETTGPNRLTLHTLPASVDNELEGTPKLSTTDEISNDKSSAGFHPSISTVPRLISVVEIIKREYIKRLEKNGSKRLVGLHQYNEIGILEDSGIVAASDAAQDERARNILQAMTGKNHTRQKQIPFMRVTLSTDELPELIAKGATHQPPTIRKFSKSAKARARKRARALQQGKEGPAAIEQGS